ncbi:hypothetical protein CONPUDRAFT_165657 [Coniophora puteana RWD-64-598 SS2]|uniref:RNA polymerase II-associated protein 1 C-terminal domain-containing protein n=1 Tax=Coniophora puteana (strain RWD-64-598) TaxID=741705 RepID=A0A5M3MR64_CONPW|nr:uncharacterized protein CONPUDRAFT_165657 [Coniophora puteana RWD-64-598 SS2]EIW81547.1 hypothetical protein CONPUDRAFT_165657 [Coniophora puteana RWD-64-598 SS2]
MARPLIGSVLERNAQSSKTQPKSPAPSPTPNGFPAATHRSKSAFARAREARNAAAAADAAGGSTRPQDVPAVVPSASVASTSSAPSSSTQPTHILQPGPSRVRDEASGDAEMLRRVEEENAHRVAAMSDAERKQEKEDVVERFGPGISDLLKRVREARERRAKEEGSGATGGRAEAASPMNVDAMGDEDDVRSDTSDPNVEVPLVNTRPRSRSVELSEKVSPPPILSTSSTRPSTPSRPNRRLRFAQLSSDDVHVYESAPASPKARTAALALPPPPDASDKSIASLGTFKGTVPDPRSVEDALKASAAGDENGQTSPMKVDATPISSSEPSNPSPSDPPPPPLEDPPDEGTPEDIRRRFFPHLPPDDPSLAWIQSSLSSSSPSPIGLPASSSSSSPAKPNADEPRFDLTGAIIPPSAASTLPSHLGLHHHADAQGRAGYTLDDMFLLARSTVPSQRATMLTVLSRIARRLSRAGDDGVPELAGKESELRSRVLAAGLGALGERGGVGIAAIDVVWACLPGWNQRSGGTKADARCIGTSAPISHASSTALLKTIQPAEFLAQLATLLSRPRGSIPPESASQLLDVLLFLARESTQLAEAIVSTPGLVNAVVGLFLLTPISTSSDSATSPGADPAALALLEALVQASRGNARAIAEGADGLLRFVVSAVPLERSAGAGDGGGDDPLTGDRGRGTELLLVGTLGVYTALAAYGMHASVATTAQAYFSALAARVLASLASLGSLDSVASIPASGAPSARDSYGVIALATAWARLVEAWTVGAIDPHMTSPPHEILWSQVAGWGWGGEMCAVAASLCRLASPSDVVASDSGAEGSRLREDVEVACAAAWNAASAWLEGARVNGVKGGEAERAQAIEALRPLFDGPASDGGGVVRRAVEDTRESLQAISETGADQAALEGLLVKLGQKAAVLGAAIRLFLACTPTGVQPATLTRPPFVLPFEDISALCGALVTHPLWDALAPPSRPSTTPGTSDTAPPTPNPNPTLRKGRLSPAPRAHTRALPTLLAHFVQLSRLVPGTPPDLWLAQALAVLGRLAPGDEAFAVWIVQRVGGMMTVRVLGALGVPVPAGTEAGAGAGAEESGKAAGASEVDVIMPFLMHTVRPVAFARQDGEEGVVVEEEERVYIAPAHPTPESIRRCTTLRLPAAYPSAQYHGQGQGQGQGPGGIPAGLPLARDWALSPIDHLLRSGTSPVFGSRSFPENWDGSETSVVRASFMLVLAAREALVRHGLGAEFAMSREEAVFGCMKVFMLEHGQPGEIGGGEGSAGGGDEVFRDKTVDSLMRAVLAPFRFGAAPNALFPPYDADARRDTGSLEDVSRRFLGAGTPFFQFYTDFLALYDAISFAHPTFSALLLPPTTASRYAHDYRKLLYADYAHVLRTLRTPVADVLGDPREWLWPLESEQTVVHAYLQTLAGGRPLQGFVRLVAVHHVAGNVWPDMRSGAEPQPQPQQKSASAKLLRAVVEQCDNATVREVLCYRQVREGGFVPPPACFSLDEVIKVQRIRLIGEMLGDAVRERLEGVFREGAQFA